MRFALFLRGINVGRIRVPMADLRELLTGLGLDEVTTWLNTGNVAFRSDEGADALRPRIEAALTARFGYEAFAQVILHERLAAIIAGCPFPAREDRHRYVILCDEPSVRDELILAARELGIPGAEGADTLELVSPGEGVVYWDCPQGSTTSTPFSTILAKKRFRASTTNRNIQTLEKML